MDPLAPGHVGSLHFRVEVRIPHYFSSGKRRTSTKKFLLSWWYPVNHTENVSLDVVYITSIVIGLMIDTKLKAGNGQGMGLETCMSTIVIIQCRKRSKIRRKIYLSRISSFCIDNPSDWNNRISTVINFTHAFLLIPKSLAATMMMKPTKPS